MIRSQIAGFRIGILAHFSAIATYLLLAIISTWPMILHFSTQIMGEHYYDRTQNIWNLWWVRHSLLELHTSPFYTDLLLYPRGADLYFHTLSLPTNLIALIPYGLMGLTAGYNFTILFALTSSAYAGFRLSHYVTRNYFAAAIGGLIPGFNTLSEVMIRGQINIATLVWFVLCVEFILRAFDSGLRRDSLLAGLFFVLSLLTVGYYEIYLLLFGLMFLVFELSQRGVWRTKLRSLLRRLTPLVGWGGGISLLLLSPYLVGVIATLSKSDIVPSSRLDEQRTLLNSADLLGFVVPNREHWLLGSQTSWWGMINPSIHDYTYLGFTTLGLAVVGVWGLRRNARTWLWVSLVISGILLAFGLVLQVNGQASVSMPFSLLRGLPLLGLVRAPERFVTLSYLGLSVLAASGMALLLAQAQKLKKVCILVIATGLLLLEIPFHSRFTEIIQVPDSLAKIASQDGKGAIIELPLTQHGRIETNRMFYQTVHGHPITSGYISRQPTNPYDEACSVLRDFATPEFYNPELTDVYTPTLRSVLTPDILVANGFDYIVVYKEMFTDAPVLTPTEPSLLSRLRSLGTELGDVIAEDDVAVSYRIQSSGAPLPSYLQLGSSWYSREESGGQPFRWINGREAALCVFSSGERTASLSLEATSFAIPRTVDISIGGIPEGSYHVQADGAFVTIETPQIKWPAGPQLVRFVVPEGAISPSALNQGADTRLLNIGVRQIRITEKGK